MNIRLLSILLALFLSTTRPSVVLAKEINGQNQPDFQNTLDLWLKGEDMAALTSLSTLSREGNTAAQILLASIASKPHMHLHVTTDLERKDRISLLRIPKGLSGKSWLTEAQKAEPLAAAILQSARIGEKSAAIAALVELGEPLTALIAARSMLYQGEALELIRVLEGLDDKLPEEATILLIWALYQAENSENGRYTGSARVAETVFGIKAFRKHELAWTGTFPRTLVEDPDRRTQVINLSPEVRSWQPLQSFCEKNCADNKNLCTAVGASTLALAGPFAMRSPSESLIPNDIYWTSPRVEADLARNTPDVREWQNWHDFTQLNSCYFESMGKLQDLHGHAK